MLLWWKDTLKLEKLGELEHCFPRVEKALRNLIKNGRDNSGRGASGKTANEIAGALKAFCSWCAKKARRYLPLSLPTLAVDADLSPQAQARQYLQEIGAAARINEHQTLITLCESILKLEDVSMDASIRFYYGRSLMELGRYQDAEREISLFLKSGSDDTELLDQALAIRTVLQPKIVLAECRAGFRYMMVFAGKGGMVPILFKDVISPSVADLRAAAESADLTGPEKGELYYFLGKRVFVENMRAKDPGDALKKALAAFRASSDLGNSEGMFMYGFMLVVKRYSGAELNVNKGWELMRSAEAKGGALAKQYFEMRPDRK